MKTGAQLYTIKSYTQNVKVRPDRALCKAV